MSVVLSQGKRLLALLATAALVLALVGVGLVKVDVPSAQAQGNVTVRLDPATASGNVNDVFTIKVYVDNVPTTGVQGWQVRIDFDPSVVQLNPGQSASTAFAGNLYATGTYNPFNFFNPGSTTITMGQTPLGLPASYPGGSNLLLATIQWKAVGSGTSALNTNGSKIIQDAPSGVVYSPLTELDGQITVAAFNPYDVNNDGMVNALDISLTAEDWQATDPASLAIFDFNHNNIVDVADIMLVAAHWSG